MILVKTTTPTIIDSTAWHGRSFNQTDTNLCAINSTLSAEYGLSYDARNFAYSSDPVGALRVYMQNIILQGPSLDPQTLLMHIDNVLSLPKNMVDPLIKELDDAFEIAARTSSGNGFNNSLANLLNTCGSPCNYFHPVGDVIALLATSSQMNTNNVAPLWDKDFDLFHAPTNVAAASFNKISSAAQRLLISTSQAVRSIAGAALSPIFTSNRISQEKTLLEQGKSLGYTSHGSYLATDPFPYFQTQDSASNLLARAKGSLMDCFRLHEFKYRYNPVDANMNLAVATNYHIRINSEGSAYNLNAFGKPKMPLVRPSKYSIGHALDYKDSRYRWDDEENWTRFPRTGKKATESTNTPQKPPTSKPSAQTAGAKVTDYGQANDPNLDSNSAKGIGISGIGEGGGPAGMKGGNYLLKDYSMAVSPDIEAQMRANGIQVGDWVNVQTTTGETFIKRFDDRTSNRLSGRVDFYSPVGRAAGLDNSVISITKADGPPPGYEQPPRYVYGQAMEAE